MTRDESSANIGCGFVIALSAAPVWLVLGYVISISFGPAQGVPHGLGQLLIYGIPAVLVAAGVYMIAVGVQRRP